METKKCTYTYNVEKGTYSTTCGYFTAITTTAKSTCPWCNRMVWFAGSESEPYRERCALQDVRQAKDSEGGGTWLRVTAVNCPDGMPLFGDFHKEQTLIIEVAHDPKAEKASPKTEQAKQEAPIRGVDKFFDSIAQMIKEASEQMAKLQTLSDEQKEQIKQLLGIIDQQHEKLDEIKAANAAHNKARDDFRKIPDPLGVLDGPYIDTANRLAAILNSL